MNNIWDPYNGWEGLLAFDRKISPWYISWWRDGFLTKARGPSQPLWESQILFIVCLTKYKSVHHKKSKNRPNIWVHCGQQRVQHYKSAAIDAWHGGIVWILPYLVVGKSLKMDCAWSEKDQLNPSSGFPPLHKSLAWVCGSASAQAQTRWTTSVNLPLRIWACIFIICQWTDNIYSQWLHWHINNAENSGKSQMRKSSPVAKTFQQLQRRR